jgi:hypothetical protein
MLRIPLCLDNRLIDGGKVVSPTHPPHFTLQKHYYFNVSGTHFCQWLSKPQDLVPPEGISPLLINQFWIIYILKALFPTTTHWLTLYLLLKFSRSKLAVGILWILFISVYTLSQLDSFAPLMSVMAEGLVLQPGASRLQAVFANSCCFKYL